MMRLSELAPEFRRADDPRDPEITSLTEDSRRVERGSLFVAVRGTALDGHTFIGDAIERGASALVLESADAIPAIPPFSAGASQFPVPLLVAPSSRTALAQLAARFYGHPARELRLIGFTGTFGKTTTSDVLRVLLEASGRRVGVVGSLGTRYRSFSLPAGGLTTPAPVELHGTLRALADAGAETVIMEVTTHALRLGRVDGLQFADGLLAAIMPGEHTDFHHSYEDYVSAKGQFLQLLSADAVLAYDRDNTAARRLADGARVRKIAGLSLGPQPAASPDDLTLADVVLDENGALMTVRGERLRSALLGRPNVRNVGLALALALALGDEVRVARDTLPRLEPVRRRMERFTIRERTILDDTAGHPDSLRAAFEVADLLPRRRSLVVYAVRGNRGADINRRNALTLADLTAVLDARPLIVTAAAETAGPSDRPSALEVDATRFAFRERGRPFIWHDTLAAAAADAAANSEPGDLILLLGAQGMNEGARLLRERLG